MRIQILKSGNNKIKMSEACPWLVECPPEPTKK